MMSYCPEVLEIISKDKEVLARFRSVDFPNEDTLEQSRLELDAYLDAHECETLTFDLAGVVIIPSTMLGILLVYRQRGIHIRIVNPSENVLAVLEVTKLRSKIEVLTT